MMKCRKKWYVLVPLFALSGLIYISYFQHLNNFTVIYHDQSSAIWVYDGGERRCLSFSQPLQGIRQGCINLDDSSFLVFPYQRVILQEIKSRTSISPRILVVGLGAGTLISALQQQIPSSSIDIVEINHALPKIASEYFGFQLRRQDTLYVLDGVEYIKNHTINKQYDIICLDAFGSNYIPQSFLVKEFIANLQNALATDGVVFVNSFAGHSLNSAEDELYSTAFKYFKIIKSKKNRIVISSNYKL